MTANVKDVLPCFVLGMAWGFAGFRFGAAVTANIGLALVAGYFLGRAQTLRMVMSRRRGPVNEQA